MLSRLSIGESSFPPSPFRGKALTCISYSLPTLPQDLSTTLRGTGGTEFEKFLSNSNQLGTLSNSPGVTIFALNDTTMASVRNNFTNATLGQHIILGFPGYSPSFNLEIPYNTAAGYEIVVKKNGTNYFVNGVKIVRPDVITKNGVVHYVERVSFFRFSLSFEEERLGGS